MTHIAMPAKPITFDYGSSAATRDTSRRFLWKFAGPFICIVAVLFLYNVKMRVADPDPNLNLGVDLAPSYVAGTMIRQGRARDMYDKTAIVEAEHALVREARLNMSYGPWLNPPFFALAFVPLSYLPYRTAAAVFLGFNLAMVAAGMLLMVRIQLYRAPAEAWHWKNYLLPPMLMLLPLSFWQAMGHQQNTFVSLVLLASAVCLWRANKLFYAGLLAGLLFFKPQLALVFALVLIGAGGWQAMAGVAVTGFTLLLITLIALPGCLQDFLTKLPPILHNLQFEMGYNWARQITWHGFWRLGIQGHQIGTSWTSVRLFAAVSNLWCAAVVAFAVWRYRRGNRDAVTRDRLIAVAIIFMPLIMPYYMDYDLLLLAIPATLLAAEWIANPERIAPADHVLMWLWCATGIASHFVLGLASHTRINLAPLILLTLACLYLARFLRNGSTDAPCASIS